jgi:gas vesicle protein
MLEMERQFKARAKYLEGQQALRQQAAAEEIQAIQREAEAKQEEIQAIQREAEAKQEEIQRRVDEQSKEYEEEIARMRGDHQRRWSEVSQTLSEFSQGSADLLEQLQGIGDNPDEELLRQVGLPMMMIDGMDGRMGGWMDRGREGEGDMTNHHQCHCDDKMIEDKLQDDRAYIDDDDNDRWHMIDDDDDNHDEEEDEEERGEG